MRIIAFIVSIFVFALAMMPCEDAAAISENESFIHFDDPSQDNSQSNEDDCTNFCLCQCCGTPITKPSFYTYNEMAETVWVSYSFHYSSLYSFDYSKGIWHPPTFS